MVTTDNNFVPNLSFSCKRCHKVREYYLLSVHYELWTIKTDLFNFFCI